MKIEKPTRATRTFVQKLVAPPERVFPLLCPVREADWLDGWDPLAVYTDSGIAEPGCVFITKAAPHPALAAFAAACDRLDAFRATRPAPDETMPA